jgi:two-component system, chemotaxis family, protein-glutamate methylesterase/glutaminase
VSPRRDIVVIGASAGGIQAVQTLVAGLPADFPASVFVVQHLHAGFSSKLPEILSRRGKLRATHAVHGEAIAPGRIYVAAPTPTCWSAPATCTWCADPRRTGTGPPSIRSSAPRPRPMDRA